jgi:hypothetical protein
MRRTSKSACLLFGVLVSVVLATGEIRAQETETTADPTEETTQKEEAADKSAATESETVSAPESAASTETSEEQSDEEFLASPSETSEPEAEDQGEAPGEGQSEESGEGDGKPPRDHAKQGFVNVLAGTGWFLVAPYDKNDKDKMCEESDDDPNQGEPVCTGRSGWHLDMLGGYGIFPGFEVFAIFRLGLEQPSSGGLINQPKTRQIGAGVKVYTPSDGLFKIGFGIAPLFDFSDHGGADVGYDFVVHVPIQAHFDFVRWFGAYLQISPNISFISEFRLEFTGGLGVQGRFP